MNTDLLNTKQVQQRLRVSERTIFNLLKRGELKGFKAGREWRFRESDLQDYEDRQRRKAEGNEEGTQPLVRGAKVA